jgi:hypothetical protein
MEVSAAFSSLPPLQPGSIRDYPTFSLVVSNHLKFISPAYHRRDMYAPIKNRHLFQERRFIIVLIGLPGKIRTCDLMVRSFILGVFSHFFSLLINDTRAYPALGFRGLANESFGLKIRSKSPCFSLQSRQVVADATPWIDTMRASAMAKLARTVGPLSTTWLRAIPSKPCQTSTFAVAMEIASSPWFNTRRAKLINRCRRVNEGKLRAVANFAESPYIGYRRFTHESKTHQFHKSKHRSAPDPTKRRHNLSRRKGFQPLSSSL